MMVHPVSPGLAQALPGSPTDSAGALRPAGAALSSGTSRVMGPQDALHAGQTSQTSGVGAYARLLTGKDRALEEALAVRTADTQLARLRERQAALRETTTAILKQYPPFPLESEDRQRYLRAITALRHQIDALTVPPPLDPTGGLQRLAQMRLPDIDQSEASDAAIAQLDAALSSMQDLTDSLQTELRIWADLKAADTVRVAPAAEESIRLSLRVGQALETGPSLLHRHEALEAFG
jgi:hypothetical protein